ncbi:teichoic acid translocation permease [Staphylococcus americanisciuri]|uniref:Teichoic acid translocation permease n=1 Tax=Staphylococcus americanisciuri TaxID=2973940 RepID=A0ABT2F4A6_9STAP|nr:teichoic acid translocation permease [Staphylococcus americanisciuri]MCS4487281.1 teichoic acid translocation permease [Staphylococcus americanisciuri]
MHRRWVLLTLLVSTLFMLVTSLFFKLTGTIDVVQVSIHYRLTGVVTFAVIWIAIYNNYRFFPRDYYVTRHFNSSPFLHVLLSGVLYGLVLFVLMIVMIILKSINTETTWLGVGFYSLMSMFFIITLSFLLGVIYMIYPKLNRLFYIVSALLLLLVPVLYTPSDTPGIVTHLLMLNPFYYLVNGMQQSVIVGHDALNHLGYHLYFLCFMGLMIVFSFALRDYVTQLRPNEHTKPINTEEDTIETPDEQIK